MQKTIQTQHVIKIKVKSYFQLTTYNQRISAKGINKSYRHVCNMKAGRLDRLYCTQKNAEGSCCHVRRWCVPTFVLSFWPSAFHVIEKVDMVFRGKNLARLNLDRWWSEDKASAQHRQKPLPERHFGSMRFVGFFRSMSMQRPSSMDKHLQQTNPIFSAILPDQKIRVGLKPFHHVAEICNQAFAFSSYSQNKTCFVAESY